MSLPVTRWRWCMQRSHAARRRVADDSTSAAGECARARAPSTDNEIIWDFPVVCFRSSTSHNVLLLGRGLRQIKNKVWRPLFFPNPNCDDGETMTWRFTDAVHIVDDAGQIRGNPIELHATRQHVSRLRWWLRPFAKGRCALGWTMAASLRWRHRLLSKLRRAAPLWCSSAASWHGSVVRHSVNGVECFQRFFPLRKLEFWKFLRAIVVYLYICSCTLASSATWPPAGRPLKTDIRRSKGVVSCDTV